jgi:4-amino-4-deoxy-L-arabinose transferase-like glycosyltransferase
VRPRAAATSVVADGAAILFLLTAAKLALHFGLNGRYGYWIDELYFIACGEHLAWGYVDQPPLIAVVAKVSRALLGDSLFAIRFFPALAGAGLVLLTGWMARALGGGRFAQLLAAVAVIVVPVYLAFHNLLTMNAFEPLFWTACAYLVLLSLRDAQPRWWLLVGLIAGVGLLNKYSMAFFGVSLAAGLLLTPQRRELLNPWVWLALVMASLIVLPNLVWELRLGWPTIELLRNAKLYQHQPVSPLEFVWGQIQVMHPFTLPLWIAGVAFYLRAPEAVQFRCLGWTFLILFLVSMLTEAKTYYLAPIYPMLFAGGAVATERFIAVRGWNWLKPASVVVLLAGGALLAPYALPVLPIDMVPRYLAWVGIKEVRPERRAVGNVPQLFADMFGWNETIAAVAHVYGALSPDDQARCAIWGRSYGEAAAVDFFGRAYHLPAAISGHQNYYLWGPRDYTGALVITVNISTERLRPWFDQVELAETVSCPYCMPDRSAIPIHLCRGLKVPLKEFWPQVKCWTCDKPAMDTMSEAGKQ